VLAQPKFAAPPRHVERVRTATKRRVRRTRRRIHRPVFAVVTLATGVLVMLLAYVTCTSNITSLNYALSHAQHERAALVVESARLDDRIAALESPERLAEMAARLKMNDPHVYAVVPVPEPKLQPKPHGIAFFGWIPTR
jgi:cell division protein FtsL